jgi:hypothetical protein
MNRSLISWAAVFVEVLDVLGVGVERERHGGVAKS